MIAQTNRNSQTDISAVVANLEKLGAKKIKRRTNTYNIAISFHLKNGPKSPKAMCDFAATVLYGTGWMREEIGQAIGDYNYVLKICRDGTL